MLLAVTDLIAGGKITTNFIQFTPELRDAFDLYWSQLFGRERPGGTPLLPLFHLKSDRSGHLIPLPGQEAVLAVLHDIGSITQLHAVVLGAALDPEPYNLVCVRDSRTELRRVIIETYFIPDVPARHLEVG